MIRIFEALPTQTRGREFAQTELPADAHSIATTMSAKYPEFLYTVEGTWNGEQFAIRYQDGHKLPSERINRNVVGTTEESEAAYEAWTAPQPKSAKQKIQDSIALAEEA